MTRNLPGSFVAPWDSWLQDAMATSKSQLADNWLDYYLTCPLWRFFLDAGVCGNTRYAGVMMPSVDRVGRYFPLVIATELPATTRPLRWIREADTWFADAEALILTALEDELDLDAFAEAVALLKQPDSRPMQIDPPARHQDKRIHCRQNQNTGLDLDPVTEHLLEDHFSPFSLWWTLGSEQVAACFNACAQLPPTEGFSALLIGDWERWGWSELQPGVARDADGSSATDSGQSRVSA